MSTKTYRVRDGHRLAHNGQVLEGGALVDLEDALAEDMAISQHVESPQAQEQAQAEAPRAPREKARESKAQPTVSETSQE